MCNIVWIIDDFVVKLPILPKILSVQLSDLLVSMYIGLIDRSQLISNMLWLRNLFIIYQLTIMNDLPTKLNYLSFYGQAPKNSLVYLFR